MPSHPGLARPAAAQTVAGRVFHRDDEWHRSEAASHHALLKNYLQRCGLQPCDAEDLCQQAYLRLLESSQDTPPQSTKALLFHIARNLLIDLRRSARHRWLRLTGNLDDLDCVTVLDPERHAIARENLEHFIATVEELPPRRRQAFLLRRVNDVSLKTIAGTMNVGIPAVEQHLTLALRTFRAAGLTS